VNESFFVGFGPRWQRYVDLVPLLLQTIVELLLRLAELTCDLFENIGC